jgi:hypothetical protein
LKKWKKGQRRRSGVSGCGRKTPMFFEHEELLVSTDDAEYGWLLVSSRFLRTIFEGRSSIVNLTLMLNGGPLGAESGSRCRPAVSRQSEIYPPLILLWATSPNRNYLVEFIKIVDVGK